ncbi:MAG: hypothetical protein QOD75_3334 [Blastocatellia bacterium]|jgi:hypothetical protein|nr:hypothetical protein [Blastocatellia bacterium]
MEFEGDGCHTEYKLKSVTYRDLTGDGKEEALIHIEDYTACGSSGVSDNYYIYTMRNNRPHLLWRFGTGGFADAGLMDFRLRGRDLIFQLFGKYKIVGPKFVSLGEDSISKWDPKHYSRIRISWDGKRFRQRTLKILPFPYKDIHEYWDAVGYTRK